MINLLVAINLSFLREQEASYRIVVLSLRSIKGIRHAQGEIDAENEANWNFIYIYI